MSKQETSQSQSQKTEVKLPVAPAPEVVEEKVEYAPDVASGRKDG